MFFSLVREGLRRLESTVENRVVGYLPNCPRPSVALPGHGEPWRHLGQLRPGECLAPGA